MSNTVNDLLRRIRALESGTGIGAGGDFSTGSVGTGGSGGSTVAAIPNPVIITDGTATDGKFEVLVSPSSTFAGIYGNSADTTPLAQLYEADVTGGTDAAAGIRIANTYTQNFQPTAVPQGTPLQIIHNVTQLDSDAGVLVGSVSATGLYGPRALVNIEGTTQIGADQATFGFTPIGFGDMLVEKNVPGSNRTMTPGWVIMSARITAADTNTVTLHNNDIANGRAGFVDAQTFATSNAGTINGTANTYETISFLSMQFVQGNTHLSTRTGLKVNDLNEYLGTPGTVANLTTALPGYDNLMGTVDTQYGIYIRPLGQATTNIGILNSSGTVWAPTAQTITGTSSSISIAAAGTEIGIASAAPYVLASTPTIPNGLSGQILRIHNNGPATISFQDVGALPGSNLRLNQSVVALAGGDSLDLYYVDNSLGAGGWYQPGSGSSLGNPITVWDGTAADGKLVLTTTGFGPGLALYNNSTDTTPVLAVQDLAGTAQIAFGPGGSTAVDTYVIRNAAGKLQMWDGTAGDGSVRLETSAFGPALNMMGTSTDVNPVMQLFLTSLNFGAGGASAVDVKFARTGTAAATLTGSLALKNALIGTPTTDTLSAAGSTIGITSAVRQLNNTSGGALTLTSAPTIADGTNGQILVVFNGSANNVVIQDQGTLAASNLRLSATTITLGTRDSITLMFSSTVGDWIQVAQTNVL